MWLALCISHGVTHETIANRLTPWIAALAFTALQAHAADRRIVIHIAERKLFLIEDNAIRKTYDTAVGKPSTPSPEGTFTIVNRIPHPTWYGSRKPVAPGRKNPLGTRWLGLSAAGYGIHGTNNPASIGKAASKGCIRMRNRDVEELFELVDAGVTVELIGGSTTTAAE